MPKIISIKNESMTASEKIFVDTAPFIYLLQNHPTFAQKVEDYLADHDDAAWYTSVLTLTEYGVKPARAGDTQALGGLESFLEEVPFGIESITKEVARVSVRLRVKYTSLRAMDGLQLAAALEAGCNQFLTNDKKLRHIDEITIIIVSDL